MPSSLLCVRAVRPPWSQRGNEFWILSTSELANRIISSEFSYLLQLLPFHNHDPRFHAQRRAAALHLFPLLPMCEDGCVTDRG